MLKQPDVRALPPPPGAIPDVTHPHNSVYKYNLACQVLTYIIVGTIVLARIFAKVTQLAVASTEGKCLKVILSGSFALVDPSIRQSIE
ncbi:MAG: hypothetical protein Q9201_004210 [Fulgogasparrea decipioides]